MARVFFTGFQTGAVMSDGGTNLGTGLAWSTSTTRTGGRSLQVNVTNVQTASWQSSALDTTSNRWARIWVNVVTPGASNNPILGSNAANCGNVTFSSDGAGGVTVAYYNGSTQVGIATSAFLVNTWTMVEWRTGTGAGDLLRIDGVVVVTGTPATTFRGYVGVTVAAVANNIFYADFSVDDANWPGPGSVALLVPISDDPGSDNSWTKPGGVSSNRFTSIDNTPPVGIADTTSSGSAENQLRNAANNFPLIMNMSTYSSKGVGITDVINAMQSFVIVAAPVSTGAKTGSQQLTSNPAAGSATAFAANSGQYWTGVAAGTFPSGWKREAAAIISSPSAAFGASPVLTMNITGGTASRIAMVCFMGVFVDFSPGGPLPVPRRQYSQLLAH